MPDLHIGLGRLFLWVHWREKEIKCEYTKAESISKSISSVADLVFKHAPILYEFDNVTK